MFSKLIGNIFTQLVVSLLKKVSLKSYMSQYRLTILQMFGWTLEFVFMHSMFSTKIIKLIRTLLITERQITMYLQNLKNTLKTGGKEGNKLMNIFIFFVKMKTLNFQKILITYLRNLFAHLFELKWYSLRLSNQGSVFHFYLT